jgi:hypothetical protein
MSEMSLEVANAERLAALTLADVLMPPPPVDYVPGPRRTSFSPSARAPIRDPTTATSSATSTKSCGALSPDDPCRVVTLQGSAQIGKTVVANVFCGGSLEMDPADFPLHHPTEDNASRWSKMKLMPFIRGTTALTAIFPQRERDGSDSVLFKERRDGRASLLISGANSPASLSQVSMPRQAQDDLSKWEMNAPAIRNRRPTAAAAPMSSPRS